MTMEAPVVVINTVPNPLKTEKIDPNTTKDGETTGFPFDDTNFEDRDRDRPFRSHIDDIVKRHPELAGHLNFDGNFDRFPFRSNTWGPKRRGSASSGEGSRPSGSAEYPESRRFARPFGSRFEERFGFPFSRTFDGEPQYYYQKQEKPETKSPEEQPQQQQSKPQQEQQEQKPAEKPPQVPNTERGRKPTANIQQSNTTDLGQKQDPVQDSRGQRSMSAPPENRAGQQRYVSSINIPIQPDGGSAQQAPPQPQQQQQQQQPQQQQQQPQQSRSNERVIPIHVEGRDEPVMPKHGNQSYNQPPPQPERAFGQRPAGFGNWGRPESPYYTGDPNFFPGEGQFYPGETQYFDEGPQYFMNRGEPHQQRSNADQYFSSPFKQQQQQQQQPHYQKQQQQQQQKPQPAPQQQQQQQTAAPPQQQQQQQQQQQEQQQQAPPPQPTPKAGPINQIKCIQKDVLELMNQVEQFNGKPKDKQYLYLDEMLTRNLLKLDDVETEGKDNIRQARKEAINCIQRCISILEAKAAANQQLRSELMDVDAKIEAPPGAEPIPLKSLEVSGVSRSGTESTVNKPMESEQTPNVEEATPMEVVPSAPVENTEANQTVPPAAQPNDTEVKAVDSEVKKEENPNVPGSSDAAAAAPEEQQKEENKEQPNPESESKSEQSVQETASQAETEAKEEVKDKKEKKKVKKKEKTSEKSDKTEKK